jgi:hypothetical protein
MILSDTLLYTLLLSRIAGRDVNVLSAARFWLFGSRDIWFEIGLPLFLRNALEWDTTFVGLFLGVSSVF